MLYFYQKKMKEVEPMIWKAILILLLAVIAGFVYFLPVLFACYLGCKGKGRLFLLNLLLGWTAVGWAILLFHVLHAPVKENKREEKKNSFTASASIDLPQINHTIPSKME